MIVLSYRGKVLKVDADIIQTFTDMEITRQATIKEKEQAISGSAAKGGYADVSAIKADSVSMEVPLVHGAGVDVENEVDEWRALVDGESARMYFAGRDFLGVNVVLTGCDATEINIGGDGTWTHAKLKLTFTQSETGKPVASAGKKLTPQERFKKMTANAWKKADKTIYTALSAEEIARMNAIANAARKKGQQKPLSVFVPGN